MLLEPFCKIQVQQLSDASDKYSGDSMMHTFHTLIPHTHTHVCGCSTLLHKFLKALPLGSILSLRAVGRSALVLANGIFSSSGFSLQQENLNKAVTGYGHKSRIILNPCPLTQVWWFRVRFALDSNGYLCVIQHSVNLPDDAAQILCVLSRTSQFFSLCFFIWTAGSWWLWNFSPQEQLKPGLELAFR